MTHEVRFSPVRMREIALRVAARHCVRSELLFGRARYADVVAARHQAWRAIREETGAPFAAIGKLFGRDHSTIVHGVKMAGRGA